MVYMRSANRDEDAAGQIPYHVISGLWHKVASQQDRGNIKAHKRQQPDSGHGPVLSVDILEVKREVVNGDKERSSTASHTGIQEKKMLVRHKSAWEQLVLFGCECRKILSNTECNQTNAEHHKQGDDAVVVPGPLAACKTKDHDKGHICGHVQDDPQPVQPSEFLHERRADLLREGRKYEDINR